ncbi:MAG: S8 family serine peptidase [Deltaproteobacteria bacterium]|nr:S8 family serine peptidase [Deltaproteobacteria bacterium]
MPPFVPFIVVLCTGAPPPPGLEPLAPSAGIYGSSSPDVPGACSFEPDRALPLATFPDDPPDDALWPEQDNLSGPGSIHADEAWRLETGGGTIIAVLDTGVDTTHEDVYRKLALNPGELEGLVDADGDGVLTVDDAGAAENAARVPDANGNGFIDRADIGAAFEDGIDDDGDGFVDNVSGWDFEDGDADETDTGVDGHGTFVGGLAGASADNGVGGAGACPDCRLLYVRVGRAPMIMTSRLVAGVEYAVAHGASVIHMSIGAIQSTPALDAAFRHAHAAGVFAAAASGNEHMFHANLPASSPEVVAIGALQRSTTPGDEWRSRAAYSDYGPHVFLSAPSEVTTPAPRDTYIQCGGTSCATPHVSATAALLFARTRRMELDPPIAPDEVVQILRASAEDLYGGDDDAAEGWDPWTGYGRVDAGSAVWAVELGDIPPVARIDAPGWYAIVDPADDGLLDVTATVRADRSESVSWELEVGTGTEPDDWTAIAAGDTERDAASIARLDLATLEPPAPRFDAGARILPDGGLVTLRLHATDASGRVGEARRAFFLRADTGSHPGFPREIGAGVAASPAIADVDGDSTPEIVIGAADGSVHLLSGPTGRELPGWPVATDDERGADIVSSPAVGDLDGDGSAEIVLGTIAGQLHAWHADGSPLEGWPIDLGDMILATPVLADLDGDGRKEVVTAPYDGPVHALTAQGVDIDGWPVVALDETVAEPRAAGTSASPAVGDLDGDGTLEVILGSGEGYGPRLMQTGRVYAWHSDGSPVLGWPVRPQALQALPGFLLFTGVVGAPSLGDLDGDGTLETVVGALTGTGTVYGAGGDELASLSGSGWGASSDVPADTGVWVAGIASFGDLDGDGALDVAAPLMGMSAQLARFGNFMLGAWTSSGGWLGAFPRAQEGYSLLVNPAIADLDGDGVAEVLAGSSGRVLHAVNRDGDEPAGWPKHLADWIAASPAVWDLDGDGLLEVVAVTRSGRVHVWDQSGPLVRGDGSIAAAWPMFRHDPARTGSASTPLALPLPVEDERVAVSGGGCSCGLTSNPTRSGWPFVLAVLALVWRRRLRELVTRRDRGASRSSRPGV